MFDFYTVFDHNIELDSENVYRVNDHQIAIILDDFKKIDRDRGEDIVIAQVSDGNKDEYERKYRVYTKRSVSNSRSNKLSELLKNSRFSNLDIDYSNDFIEEPVFSFSVPENITVSGQAELADSKVIIILTAAENFKGTKKKSVSETNSVSWQEDEVQPKTYKEEKYWVNGKETTKQQYEKAIEKTENLWQNWYSFDRMFDTWSPLKYNEHNYPMFTSQITETKSTTE